MSEKREKIIEAINLDNIHIMEEGIAPVVAMLSQDTGSPGPTDPPPPTAPDTTAH